MKTEIKKKLYTTPKMEIYEMIQQTLLAGSGVNSLEYGIGYGGVDDEGDIDVD